MYKGKHASNRVISVIFSVILNQRTSSTLQSSALKITELSAVEVGESMKSKSKPLCCYFHSAYVSVRVVQVPKRGLDLSLLDSQTSTDAVVSG